MHNCFQYRNLCTQTEQNCRGLAFLRSQNNSFKTPSIHYRLWYGVVVRLAATGK